MRKLILAFVALGAAVAFGASGSFASQASGVVNNDCSGGNVYFTFDDGPDPVSTPAVISALQQANITATFFIVGQRVGDPGGAAVLQQENAAGMSIQNHSWDHASFTGASTGTAPMTGDQVSAELNQANAAIFAAGVPYPTLYRPPYGDINSYDDLVARDMGLRIVMPWGDNIVDSQDWKGISAAQIDSNVINGYTDQFGHFKHGMQADSILSFHDGAQDTAPNTIAALPAIADQMNALHLCSSTNIRQDATGGQVPPPAPPEPANGGLVQNYSLEQLRVTGNHSEPVCFQQGGASPNSHNTNWSPTTDTHTGNVAERLDESNWQAGDAKLVLTQRQSEKSCLAPVTVGKTYTFWVWYKGDWVYQGPGLAKASIATYYLNAQNQWVYWQGGPLMPPTNGTWNLASFTSAPLPAGAQAVSFGLALQGNGTLITDDYAMAQN